MTVEELKAEAKKLGYYIMKPSTEYIKLTPCICGCKQRTELHAEDRFAIAYRCNKCGLESEFMPSVDEAKIAWNEMIERKTDDGR